MANVQVNAGQKADKANEDNIANNETAAGNAQPKNGETIEQARKRADKELGEVRNAYENTQNPEHVNAIQDKIEQDNLLGDGKSSKASQDDANEVAAGVTEKGKASVSTTASESDKDSSASSK